MPRPALLAALLLVAAASPVLAAAEKRVYRIDAVAATRAGTMLDIQVRGAVQSGGWKKPRLKVTRGDAHTVTVEFLAQPPETGDAVITALLPVAVSLKLRAPRDVLAVKAVGDANEVTAQIIPASH